MDEQKTPETQGELSANPGQAPTSTALTSPSTSSQLIDPGQWISQTWKVYTKLWKRLLLLMLLNYVAMIPLGVIAVIFMIIVSLSRNPKEIFSPIMIVSIFVVALLAYVYISIISSFFSMASVLAIAKRAESVPLKSLLQEGWHKFWGYCWVVFLVGFLVVGGMFLFIIPGIIFWVWFMFAMYIFLFEGKKGMDAVVTSREYVRGRWLGVLGRMVLIIIIMLIISYVPSLLVGFLKLKTVSGLLQTIISFAAAPLPTIASVLLYESVKSDKDVSRVAVKKEKIIYSIIAVLGFISFIALFFFLAINIVSLFSHLSDTKHPLPPLQYTNPYTIPTFAPPASST